MTRTQRNRLSMAGTLLAGLAALAGGTAPAQEGSPELYYEQRDRAPSRQAFEGTVERVQGRDVIIRIANNELRTFRLDDDSEIIVNGRWTDRNALRRGDRVRVTTSQDIGWYASRNIDPFIREIETLRTVGDSRRQNQLPEPEYDIQERRRQDQRDRSAGRRADRPAGLGVVLESAANNAGVLVTEVYRDSPADDAGVRRGDFILSIDAIEVNSPQQLVRTVRRLQPGSEVRVTISRDGEERTVTPVLSTRTDALSERERMRTTQRGTAGDQYQRARTAPRTDGREPVYMGGYGAPTYQSDGRYQTWYPDDRRQLNQGVRDRSYGGGQVDRSQPYYGDRYYSARPYYGGRGPQTAPDYGYRGRGESWHEERIENSRADRMAPYDD